METTTPQEWPASGKLEGKVAGNSAQLLLSCMFFSQNGGTAYGDFQAVVTTSVTSLSCQLTGAFLVEPDNIGACYFHLVSDNKGVTLRITRKDGPFCGTFKGDNIDEHFHMHGETTFP